jgi:hypothetical protein
MGLDNVDRKVINVMHESFDGGPVGIESIAATLNEEPDTIVDVVEPFLLKIGFSEEDARAAGSSLNSLMTIWAFPAARKKRRKRCFNRANLYEYTTPHLLRAMRNLSYRRIEERGP